MNALKLQILIPVRERSPLLAETLATITPQLNAECAVLVVDDLADGFDVAYVNAVDKATAEYVWLFADDDHFLPGAIDAVLQAINSPSSILHPPDLIVANSSVRDRTMQHVTKAKWLDHHDFTTPNRETVLVLLADLMSYVGSIIIRRDVWQETVARVGAQYMGTRFITFAVPAAARVQSVAFVSHVCTAVRYGHQSWCGDCARLNGTFKEIVWGLEDISDEAKAAIAPKVDAMWQWLAWHAANVPLPAGAPVRKAVIQTIPAWLLRKCLRLALWLVGQSNCMTARNLREADEDFTDRLCQQPILK